MAEKARIKPLVYLGLGASAGLLEGCPKRYKVRLLECGTEVLKAVQQEVPDLLVLELGLPGGEGLELLRSAKRISACFILLLCAASERNLGVQALDEGADDFVSGPLTWRELEARIRARLRHSRRSPAARTSRNSAKAQISLSGLHLDLRLNILSRGSRQVQLTGGEAHVLKLFLESPERVFSREELMSSSAQEREGSRAIDMRIANLRRKISELEPGLKAPRTIRGLGYRFI